MFVLNPGSAGRRLDNILCAKVLFVRVYMVIVLSAIYVLQATNGLSAETVLFIHGAVDGSIEKQRLELACEFYGLDLYATAIGPNGMSEPLSKSLSQRRAKAIVITADALANLDVADIIHRISERKEYKVNILILGLTDESDTNKLHNWSYGAIERAARLPNNEKNIVLKVSGNQRDVARELAGQEFTTQERENHFFVLGKATKGQTIMGISTNGQLLPNFIRVSLPENEIFFQAKSTSRPLAGRIEWSEYRERFIEIAPLMMFLRYSLNDYTWHTIADLANFTIDDPWLREPYGFLSYNALITEMIRADFHTTIAFIPWNFDRSEPQVLSLFRKYPQRLSISVHGNNHDHREFYPYDRLPNGMWPDDALLKQTANIKQAIARMEEFSKIEKVPYDRVMVFPHSIAGEMTISLLKDYDFLATVNANNIPIGAEQAQDFGFFIRSVTLQFSNFPSIRRFSANALESSDIARELFLDNPLMLYTHHDYFLTGVNRFNNTVASIKEIQPDLKWRSLGDIARHIYLERQREDGNYEIYAFTNNIVLENLHKKKATFYVRKNESSYPPIIKVVVANKSYPFERQGSEILIIVNLLSGEAADINIEHVNDFELETTSIAKYDLRIRALRLLSDFRDLTISRTALGRMFIDMFYKKG